MTYPVVRPLYMPPRRRARRPTPRWLRRVVFALSVAVAAVAGVGFSNWIGSVSDSSDGTEAVSSEGGRITPVTSRPAPSTTEAPPPMTAAPSATTTPEPPSAATLRPVP